MDVTKRHPEPDEIYEIGARVAAMTDEGRQRLAIHVGRIQALEARAAEAKGGEIAGGMACNMTAGPSAVQSMSYTPRGLTLENVENAFEYHSWDPGQQGSGTIIREALVAAAKAALREVPDCPDRSVGLRKLREARMDFNSAITHRGRF